MEKSKAGFVTATVMALLAVVILFTWRASEIGFQVFEAVFAAYGFIHFGLDFCKWMQKPANSWMEEGAHTREARDE